MGRRAVPRRRIEFSLEGYGIIRLAHGERVTILKRDLPLLPPGFRVSTWSLRRAAKAVYRDTRKTNSLQVRDYGRYWEFQLDHYNPEAPDAGLTEVIGHGFMDAPEITIGLTIFGLLAVGILGASRSQS